MKRKREKKRKKNWNDKLRARNRLAFAATVATTLHLVRLFRHGGKRCGHTATQCNIQHSLDAYQFDARVNGVQHIVRYK